MQKLLIRFRTKTKLVTIFFNFKISICHALSFLKAIIILKIEKILSFYYLGISWLHPDYCSNTDSNIARLEA